MKIKIYGAGSIGNHLANASRVLGWEVDVYDVDPKALYRMKSEIYPNRYGHWDNSIGLFENKNLQNKKYDIILIGTPPDTHLDLLLEAVKEKPKGIMVEKPVCRPNDNDIKKISKLLTCNIPIFVGYDHVVSNSIQKVCELIKNNSIGNILTIDVEFRENWEGIFAAHPWLNGPSDSYLGFWERGGGASGEHSHALNLWQYLAKESKLGTILNINHMLDYYKDKQVNYDKICMLNLDTVDGYKEE